MHAVDISTEVGNYSFSSHGVWAELAATLIFNDGFLDIDQLSLTDVQADNNETSKIAVALSVARIYTSL